MDVAMGQIPRSTERISSSLKNYISWSTPLSQTETVWLNFKPF